MRRVRFTHSDGHSLLLGSQEQNACCRRAILESGSAEGGSGSTGWCGVWVGGRGEWVNRLVRSRLLTNVGELQAGRHLSRPGSPTSHLVLDGWQGKGIRMIIFIRFPSYKGNTFFNTLK